MSELQTEENLEVIEKEIKSETEVISTIKEDKYQSRPLIEWERMLRISGLLAQKSFKIERWAWGIRGDITNLIFMELTFAIEDKSNSVIQIYAPPGLGKSTIGKSIAAFLKLKAKKLLKLEHKTKIWLTWNIWETAEAIRKAKTGDVIVQDEDKQGTGQGSQSAIKRLHNLLNTFRKKQISVVFVSPHLVKLPNVVSFVILAYGKNIEKETNKALILSGQSFLPIGHAYIKRRIDKELEDYEEIKDADIQKTIDSAGFSVVEYPQDFINKWVSKTWEEMEFRFESIPLEHWVLSIIDSIIQILAIPGDSSFRKIISDEIKLKIQLEKIRKKLARERKKEELRLKQLLSEGLNQESGHSLPIPLPDQDFNIHLRNTANQYLFETGFCDSIEKASRWSEYKLTTEPITFAQVCEKLQITDKRPDSIGRYVRGLKPSNTHLGNIFELALMSWIHSKIPSLKILSDKSDPENPRGVESVRSSSDPPPFFLERLGGSGNCDLHIRTGLSHLVCMNAKLKISEPRPSWTLLCEPEFTNNPGNSYLVLWDRNKGVQVYQPEKPEISTGSYEDLKLDSLITLIKNTIKLHDRFTSLSSDEQKEFIETVESGMEEIQKSEKKKKGYSRKKKSSRKKK